MDWNTWHLHGSWGTPLAIALMVSTLAGSTRAAAGAEGDPGDNLTTTQHVRTTDSTLSLLISEGARRSLMVRTLLSRLDRSTVIVYVQSRLLSGNLGGRLTFIGVGQPWRYLRIEIECRQSKSNQIVALGHELQHAVEIADREAAVDPASIRTLYGAIGFPIDDSRRRFESDAAREAGSRVRRELSMPNQTTSYVSP
jgi:hypothetical protein